ncbi:MAG: hypothetical protein NC184_04180 [Roseburia sp.]|nr:hypothetical protein [Roseburia sp.]
MFRKSELEKAIAACEEEIEVLEKKRLRSLSGFIAALVDHGNIDKEDVDYFKTYTDLIELEREKMRQLQEELDSL